MIEINSKWFPCELHCHTVHSDGDFTVFELLKTAKERLLEGICLTDHNTFSGFEEAKNEKDIAVLSGIEWTTYFGHMPVLGAREIVDWRKALPDNIDELLSEIHSFGGVCGIAHPYQLGTPICTGGRWDFRVKDFSKIDYMEIWSEGELVMNTPNKRAMALWHEKLSEGFRITPTLGRDWHRAEGNNFIGGCTYLLCDGEVLNSEKMKIAIKNSRTSVSLGPLFYFETDKGERVGDTVKKGKRLFKFFIDRERFEKGKFGYEIKEERIVIRTENYEKVTEIDSKKSECLLELQNIYYTAELYGKVNGKKNQLIAFTSPIYTE